MGKVCCKIPLNNALQWSVKFRLLILNESFAFAIPHTHCKVKILMLNIAICQYRVRRVVSKHDTQNSFHRSRDIIFFHSSKVTFTTTSQHITTLPLPPTGQPGGRRWDVYLHCRKRTWQYQPHDQGASLFLIHDYKTSNCNCRCKVQVEVVIRKSLPSWKANLATTQFSLAPILLCPVNLWWVW